MKRYIRIFHAANATSEINAIVPQEYGVSTDMIFYKLVRQGVFVSTDGLHYYLNEEMEIFRRKRRRKMVALLLILITLILLFTTTLMSHFVTGVH